ncbi:hypothetical protein PsYK624_155930 [Phanerochaete sordida]|uniref:Uncharacterized protein n=1 Tax=Phanerochaete sordida TaxID=48140 RepID=A0A9P3LM42_9APHY|nr:hypothetical protein PsYK624_155930 [Phanerochaete sordida]
MGSFNRYQSEVRLFNIEEQMPRHSGQLRDTDARTTLRSTTAVVDARDSKAWMMRRSTAREGGGLLCSQDLLRGRRSAAPEPPQMPHGYRKGWAPQARSPSLITVQLVSSGHASYQSSQARYPS